MKGRDGERSITILLLAGVQPVAITALEPAPGLLLDPSGGAEPRARAPVSKRCDGNTKQEKKAAGYDRAFPPAR